MSGWKFNAINRIELHDTDFLVNFRQFWGKTIQICSATPTDRITDPDEIYLQPDAVSEDQIDHLQAHFMKDNGNVSK